MEVSGSKRRGVLGSTVGAGTFGLLVSLLLATTASAAPAHRPKIYLGGPDVFYENPAKIAEMKKRLAAQYGFEGVFPLDNAIQAKATPQETGFAIFEANMALMRQCDLMIANMTPFRGPSMDVGTAFEMGFMSGLGKPVLAYTEDGRGFTERTTEYVKSRGGKVEAKIGGLRDSDGLGLENFGFVDNLMLDGSVRRSGSARIERSFEAVLRVNAARLLAQFQGKGAIRTE